MQNLTVLNHLLLLSSDLEEFRKYQTELKIMCHLEDFEVYTDDPLLKLVEKYVQTIHRLVFHELPTLVSPAEFLEHRLQSTKVCLVKFIFFCFVLTNIILNTLDLKKC